MPFKAVRDTPELRRVLALPRRVPDPAQLATLAEQLTALLKTPNGTMTLRPAQALALHDVRLCRGAYIPLEVGAGKTLTSFFSAYILDAKRPLMVQPASMIQKTEEDHVELSQHWELPTNIRYVSYQTLGRLDNKHWLEEYNPDLLILDESQFAKNYRAAVTRRIARWMAAHPTTMFIALTGTAMRRSLMDFGPILRWCLKDKAPVPKTNTELKEWAAALDENVHELSAFDVGALTAFSDGDDDINAVRQGFRDRLNQTPGVIATIGEGENVGVPIRIRPLHYDVAPITDRHFWRLRKKMLTPDDWQLMQGTEVWQRAKELALGFHGVWVPRPPEEWRQARRNWNAFVRETLSNSRTLDSPLEVANMCDAGRLDNTLLEAWRAVEKTYTIKTAAIWHDDSALKVCLEWMRRHPGLVWTEHVEFSTRLAELSGCKYYGAKGLASDGSSIKHAKPGVSAIASMDACKVGFNLQKIWHRNLITSCPEASLDLQQLLGRTHRTGQTEPVEVDVLLGCLEHIRAWRKALANAYAVRSTTGAQSKLLIADISEWPDEDTTDAYSGSRWGLENANEQDKEKPGNKNGKDCRQDVRGHGGSGLRLG